MKIELFGAYNGTHYFSAGVAGLATALQSSGGDIDYEITDSTIEIDWKDLPSQLAGLIDRTYRIKDGLLYLPDRAGNPYFQDGLLNTTLAIPATRKTSEVFECQVPTIFGKMKYSFLGVESTIYHSFAKRFATAKGKLRESIDATSWLIPNATGGIAVRPEVAIACMFSPLNWLFFDIQNTRLKNNTKALICPTLPAMESQIKTSIEYQDFVAGSLEDAVLMASLQNSGIEMHGYEYRRKAANRAPEIIKAATLSATEEYADLLEKFPNGGGITNGETVFVKSNPVRAIAAQNIARGEPWYLRLGDKLSADDLSFEKLRLTQKLSPQQKWKNETGFESTDHRRGYKAGYNAAKRGQSLTAKLPENEWGKGYGEGFNAGLRNRK
jgi:hypothetical protein